MIFSACLEPCWPSGPRGPSLDRWGLWSWMTGTVWLRRRGWSLLFCGSRLLYRIWSNLWLLLILDVALTFKSSWQGNNKLAWKTNSSCGQSELESNHYRLKRSFDSTSLSVGCHQSSPEMYSWECWSGLSPHSSPGTGPFPARTHPQPPAPPHC